MKPLHQFTNVDKARLLHQLFPQEMPALLDFIKGFGESIEENHEMHRRKWGHQLFHFDDWLNIATNTVLRIKKYGVQLHKSPNVFADQLFDVPNVFFMVDCIIKYVTIRKHPNEKFTKAVDLLFNP